MKNANVKDLKDFVDRLINGESFYTPSVKRCGRTCYEKIFFDISNMVVGKPPFRIDRRVFLGSMDDSALCDLVQKNPWQECVSPENPVLCLVSDDEGSLLKNKRPRFVIGINKSNQSMTYKTEYEICWKYAKPVTKSDLFDDGCCDE